MRGNEVPFETETKDVALSTNMDKTLVKGLAVLERLSFASEPVKLVDLAKDMKLTKSGVHRLLQTLMKLNYVEAHEGGRYTASLKLWRVGAEIVSRIDARRVLQPFLSSLAEQSMETVHLAVYNRTHVVYIDKAEGSHAIRVTSAIGTVAPIHCVATGKIFLAHQPQEAVDALASQLTRFTAKTVTSIEQLNTELAQIRRDGFAINRGEWMEGVGGLAAPVWNAHGKLELAIGITVPLNRFGAAERRSLARMVVRAAADGSRALGAAGSSEDIAA